MDQGNVKASGSPVATLLFAAAVLLGIIALIVGRAGSQTNGRSEGSMYFTYVFYRTDKIMPYEVSAIPGLLPELSIVQTKRAATELNNKYLTALISSQLNQAQANLVSVDSKKSDEFIISFEAPNTKLAGELIQELLKALNAPLPDTSDKMIEDLDKRKTHVVTYTKRYQELLDEVQKGIKEFGYSLPLIDKKNELMTKLAALETSLIAINGNIAFLQSAAGKDEWEMRLLAEGKAGTVEQASSKSIFVMIFIGLILAAVAYVFLKGSSSQNHPGGNSLTDEHLLRIAVLLQNMSKEMLAAYFTTLKKTLEYGNFSHRKICFIRQEVTTEIGSMFNTAETLKVDQLSPLVFTEDEAISFYSEVQFFFNLHETHVTKIA